MVTSYCADGPAAWQVVLDSTSRIHCFYDLDTPVTISRLLAGERVEYLPADGLGGFDLVLSYTGGEALNWLTTLLGGAACCPALRQRGSADPSPCGTRS